MKPSVWVEAHPFDCYSMMSRNNGGLETDDVPVSELLTHRRELIAAGVSLTAVGLTGCLSSGGDGDGAAETTAPPEDGDGAAETTAPPEDGEGEEHEELPEGVSEDEFQSGPVPEAYRTTTSLGNEDRNPDDLSTKADVDFSEFAEAQEMDSHDPGTTCGNCADYIADKNGDTFGACAEVEGYIDAADWCTVYEELPEPSVPEGMSKDELATAEVPEAYRTATSQGDEERNPDDLQSHADVSLTESVEAIAAGDADPGQSCGTCADFIPDQNGDTWGACAEVEGYIAVEDWCTVYEHVTEAE
jgi:hypothetical protein